MLRVNGNYKDTIEALSELEQGLQGKAIRAGLTQAIKPILTQMKAAVPIGETRALKSALGRTTLSKRAKTRLGVPATSVAIIVGANRKVKDSKGSRRGQGYKAIWMNWGTVSIKPRPFMSDAFDANIAETENKFYIGLQAYIDKVSK